MDQSIDDPKLQIKLSWWHNDASFRWSFSRYNQNYILEPIWLYNGFEFALSTLLVLHLENILHHFVLSADFIMYVPDAQSMMSTEQVEIGRDTYPNLINC